MKSVRQVLSAKGNETHTIDPKKTVLDALRVLAEKNVGALIVVEGPRVIGILSERDYARKVILLGRSSAETPVWQIMSAPVITVGPEDGVRRCMELMTERRIRHLPVVDESGAMIGMISIGDLVRGVIEEQQETIEQLEKFIAG